jgi:Mrp family chromosome partitioning ATPase
MDNLLKELGQSYDLIILDSPPLMAAVDGHILSRKVDMTVFVLRWATTERRITHQAMKRIGAAGAHLAGVLLTQVDVKKYARYGDMGSSF